MIAQLISTMNVTNLVNMLSKTAPKDKETFSVYIYPSQRDGYMDFALVSSSDDTCVVVCDAFLINNNHNRHEEVIEIPFLPFLNATANINGKCIIEIFDNNGSIELLIGDEFVRQTIKGVASKKPVGIVMKNMINNKDNADNTTFSLSVKMLNDMFDTARKNSFNIISKDPFTQIKPSYAKVDTEKFYLLVNTNEGRARLNVTAFHVGLGNMLGRSVDTVLLHDTVTLPSKGKDVLLGVTLKNLRDLARPIFGKKEIPITIVEVVVGEENHQLVVAKKDNIHIVLTVLTRPPAF